MNVSAQGHATAQYEAKVEQPGSPGQTGQAAVGQGLSRRVSAQAPTGRQLADCEAGVTACERKSLASRWNHCCRTLEPWAIGGLEGLVIGAAIGGESFLDSFSRIFKNAFHQTTHVVKTALILFPFVVIPG